MKEHIIPVIGKLNPAVPGLNGFLTAFLVVEFHLPDLVILAIGILGHGIPGFVLHPGAIFIQITDLGGIFVFSFEEVFHRGITCRAVDFVPGLVYIGQLDGMLLFIPEND